MNKATKTTTLYFSGVGDGHQFLGLEVENQAQAEKMVGRRIGVVTAQASPSQIAKIKKALAQHEYHWVSYEKRKDGTERVRIQTFPFRSKLRSKLSGKVRFHLLDGSIKTFSAEEWDAMSMPEDDLEATP